jgi:hypothetical protein
MPRYVILLHELPAGQKLARGGTTHWDLMLEWGTVLRTWALSCEPALGLTCDAQQLADHRLAYLEYEGPVSGNRGHVTRWDAGEYEIESQADHALALILHGPRLPSRLSLAEKGDGSHFWSVSVGAAPIRG